MRSLATAPRKIVAATLVALLAAATLAACDDPSGETSEPPDAGTEPEALPPVEYLRLSLEQTAAGTDTFPMSTFVYER